LYTGTSNVNLFLPTCARNNRQETLLIGRWQGHLVCKNPLPNSLLKFS